YSLHFCLSCYRYHRDLHSFPTRRSSDLRSRSAWTTKGCRPGGESCRGVGILPAHFLDALDLAERHEQLVTADPRRETQRQFKDHPVAAAAGEVHMLDVHAEDAQRGADLS